MPHSPLNRDGRLTPEELERRRFINIHLQKGHIADVGVTGCFVQDVIEWVIEALDGFEDERPELSCRENSLAKTKLEEAWQVLDMRRSTRARAGVLGTYQPIPRPLPPLPESPSSASTSATSETDSALPSPPCEDPTPTCSDSSFVGQTTGTR